MGLKRLSKYITLIEYKDGGAQALYNHRSHVLFINYEQWELRDIDYDNLPVNEFKRLSSDKFYDILERLENR